MACLDCERIAGESPVKSSCLGGDVCGIGLDGGDDLDEMKPRSHLSAILARGALRNPSPDLCAFTCVMAMAPRKYQQCGEAAKASRKSAKAKASQARATPSPKGKAPALGDPKAFPPLGKAADTRPPPPPVPKS